VDPESWKPLPEGHIGETWISGPSIAAGYWNQAGPSQGTFEGYLDGSQPDLHPGPYLRTGDLGFLQDGELYITGRIKDLIIVQGLNHYPQDIEITVEKSHPALLPRPAPHLPSIRWHLVVIADSPPALEEHRSAGIFNFDLSSQPFECSLKNTRQLCLSF
jgi:acyl-CoA synthetase (AMP-forming)/AMP-acid ligase II